MKDFYFILRGIILAKFLLNDGPAPAKPLADVVEVIKMQIAFVFEDRCGVSLFHDCQLEVHGFFPAQRYSGQINSCGNLAAIPFHGLASACGQQGAYLGNLFSGHIINPNDDLFTLHRLENSGRPITSKVPESEPGLTQKRQLAFSRLAAGFNNEQVDAGSHG